MTSTSVTYQEDENRDSANKKKENDRIYFQNLVPGKQNSPLIDAFRQFLVEDERNEAECYKSKQLLMSSPPVLSFSNDANKKYFYESQAKKCTEFCCGGVEISHDALGKTSMNNKNHYLVSIGTGHVYEGPAKEIQKEIKNDLDKAAFGSEEQTKGIEGLKKFNAIVAEREPIKGSALDSKKSQEELPSSKVPSTHKISK